MLIGIAGEIASGKDLLSIYLHENLGWELYAFRNVVLEQAREQARINGGNPEDREFLQRVGHEYPKKYGPEIWAHHLIGKIGNGNGLTKVVHGFRNLADIHPFRAKYVDDFFLLGITASREVRWKRVQERKKKGDPQTWEEFIIADERDRGIGSYANNPWQTTEKCLQNADGLILNHYRTKQEFFDMALRALPLVR